MLSEHLSFVLSRLKLAVYNDPSDFIFSKIHEYTIQTLKKQNPQTKRRLHTTIQKSQGRKRIGKKEEKIIIILKPRKKKAKYTKRKKWINK